MSIERMVNCFFLFCLFFVFTRVHPIEWQAYDLASVDVVNYLIRCIVCNRSQWRCVCVCGVNVLGRWRLYVCNTLELCKENIVSNFVTNYGYIDA